jgi:hypothetical protein
VIAIGGSLNAYRREDVKDAFVQLPTYEVINALEDDLNKKMGAGFSSKSAQQRLAAVLLALKDLGLVTSSDRDRETWFVFDPRENLADDVPQITLKKIELARSIELSKRIAPILKEVWSELIESTGRDSGGPRNKEFEVDPFVSQLALLIDKGVAENRPQFETLDLAERMTRICLVLQEKGVVIKAGTEDIPVWLTAVKVDRRIGGAKISQNMRITLSNAGNAALLGQFHLAVRGHLDWRLTSVLKFQEEIFQLCNTRMIKIAEIDSGGVYHWEITEEGRLAHAKQ